MDITLIQAFVRWLHLLAAIFWIGGIMFVSFVLSPVLRRNFARADRIVLVDTVGRSLNKMAWAAIAVLVITGILNLLLRYGSIGSILSTLLSSGYGRILTLKLLLVAGVVLLTALHSLVWGPKLGEMARARDLDAPEFAPLVRKVALWSAVSLVGNLMIVALAAYLVAFRG